MTTDIEKNGKCPQSEGGRLIRDREKREVVCPSCQYHQSCPMRRADYVIDKLRSRN